MSINQKFENIFSVARYLQAKDGEEMISLATISRSVNLCVEEIAEVVDTVGDSLIGLARVNREPVLFIRVQ